jgi:hypothetical protein
LDACKFLVSKNADIDIKDDKNKTACDVAKNISIVEYLNECKNKKNEGLKLERRFYQAQQSVISSVTERELLSNIERNEQSVVESPFRRPVARAQKLSESDSEKSRNEQSRNEQHSSAHEYTTIVQTNQLAHNNMTSKKRNSESSESENENNNKITKVITGAVEKREISSRSSENDRKEKNKSISSSSSSIKPKANIGKLDKSLSDTSSYSSEVANAPGNVKRKGTIYDSNTD